MNPYATNESKSNSVWLSFVFSASGELIESKGKIVTVSKGGVNDAVFRMENTQRTFYINRGFEFLNENSLEELIGATAVIYFYEVFNPLDPFDQSSKNIVRLESNEELIFNM